MNEYDKALLGLPDLISEQCVFCGRPATNKHHIVFRGRGGAKHSPLFSVCGQGNLSGCHRRLHTGRLFVRWDTEQGCYEYLRCLEQHSIDWAHKQDAWVPMKRG